MSTMSGKPLFFGVTMNGLAFSDKEIPSIETRFRLARQAGAFDYIEYSPRPGEIDEVLLASERHGIPVRAGSFFYTLGRDEPLLAWHLKICEVLGADVLNIQVGPKDAHATPLSDEAIAAFFMNCAEQGQLLGVVPAFEIHINMWSEEFDRVSRVAELVGKKGAQFNITLDHSHCVFKIGNEREIARDKANGRIGIDYARLDPEHPNNYYDEWLDEGLVIHMHVRGAAPDNPANILARHSDGSFGRGVQYPFLPPRSGEWHSTWAETALDAWKAVSRKAFTYHATSAASRLKRVSAEYIPWTDYGAGAGYSVIENNQACIAWLRDAWAAIGAPSSRVPD